MALAEVPGIVPSVALPLVTVPASAPITVQVTAVFVAPVTEAIMDKVWPAVMFAGLYGLRMETTTPGPGASPIIVIVAEARLEMSALLAAVMVTVAGVGTDAGAV
jgi:hypothetical protein